MLMWTEILAWDEVYVRGREDEDEGIVYLGIEKMREGRWGLVPDIYSRPGLKMVTLT